jgi:hypothetical protein
LVSKNIDEDAGIFAFLFRARDVRPTLDQTRLRRATAP